MRSRTVIKIRLHIPEIFLGYGRFVFKAKFYLETDKVKLILIQVYNNKQIHSKIKKYSFTRVWCSFSLVLFIGNK